MVYMHVSPTGWIEAVPWSDKAPALAWFEGVISGKAMSLFVLMAGISVALMTGGSRPHTGQRLQLDRRRLALRAAVLFPVSLLVDQFSGMNLSILEYYSLWLLLLIPLLKLSPGRLLLAAAIAAIVLPVFCFIVMNYGRDWVISPFAGGQAVHGLALFWTPTDWLPKLKQLLIGGGFQTPYALPLLLAGLAVGRLDLRSPAVRRNLMFTGGAWLPVRSFCRKLRLARWVVLRRSPICASQLDRCNNRGCRCLPCRHTSSMHSVCRWHRS